MIAVIGSGKWGSAIAHAIRSANYELKLCAFRPREGYCDIKEAKKAQYLIFALSSSANEEYLKAHFEHNDSFHKVLIASKGIYKGAFMSDIFEPYFKNIAILSGPSFAAEVMQDLPTAVVISSKQHELAQEFCELFPSYIKPYICDDYYGAQVAGAYKNVIAIASGISDELELGNNARAALLSRGLVEMARFAQPFGAKLETFLSLAGAGDLFLTASSTLSRNYRAGRLLSSGYTAEQISQQLGEVVEGFKTALEIVSIAQRLQIYTPIANQVASVINGKDVKAALADLLRR